MNELITLLEAPYNLVYGVLGAISVGIWLVSAIGLFSHSAIEGFFPHPHLDTDIHVDFDASIDGHDFSFGDGFLNFLSVGQVPISIILTILFFIQAIIGVWLNQFAINQLELSLSWQLWTMFFVNFGISFFAAVFIAGFVLKPIKPFFRDYGIVRTANSLVGKVATVSSSQVTSSFGSAIFKLDGGDIVDISVRAAEKDSVFVRGQEVVIVEFKEEKNLYFVMLN